MDRPRPTAQQLAWQEAGFGLFLHFGVNTFIGREHSNGTWHPRNFDPSGLDAAQWVETAHRAGAGYVVLTAKHHDGFCLWPTRTTAYSVRSSPWRGGRGDVVGELADACRAAGMPLGVYLSPWDRNAPCYADPDAYDRFYSEQLAELCTGYGPLFELWFDGAGSQGRRYDWDRIMTEVDKHQPGAVVFNMGRRTIRWVGNEAGVAADPCHYAVADADLWALTSDLAALGGPRYQPPECDVPIRDHWFWQPDDLDTLKSTQHLLGIWYRSVGLGAGLLLNLAPDRRGLIDDADQARLFEVVDELRRRFVARIPVVLDHAPGEVTARFPHPVDFDHVELREDLLDGQRVDTHEVLVNGRVVAAGRTIGVRRWHAFAAVTGSRLTVRLDSAEARLVDVAAFRTGHETMPALEPQRDAVDPSKFDPDPD
ncbi:MAG TPA: alpha-L-fucosidase [Micromonosporaceae bacterium]